MRELVADLPESVGRREQVVISGVLDHMFARFGFWNLPGPNPTASGWRQQWFRVTEHFVESPRDDVDEHQRRPFDTRVTRMLQFIEKEYADPTLTMLRVAETISLCPSHAARLLKQQTGCGFLAHLHRYRIASARQLLVETSLSIKEIASAVGYPSPSQLSRHFKIACGETPLAFRSTRAGRRHIE